MCHHAAQLLNRADPCVDTRNNDKGELVLMVRNPRNPKPDPKP